MRQARKQRQKFQSRIPFKVDPFRKIRNKIAKNFKKFKNPLSGIIFGQNRMRQAEKGRKKFQSRIPFILDLGQKIPKKIAKKFKKLKNLSFRQYFQPKPEIGRERMKKILVPNSVHTRLRQEYSKKKAKKFKKLKNHFHAIFLAKTG